MKPFKDYTLGELVKLGYKVTIQGTKGEPQGFHLHIDKDSVIKDTNPYLDFVKKYTTTPHEGKDL